MLEGEAEVQSGLDSIRETLKQTADYTLASSEHVVRADTQAHDVAKMAQKELSRLRRITNDLEIGVEYILIGNPIAELLQPGRRGQKQDREAAGLFLQELVEVVDKGAITLLSVSLVYAIPPYGQLTMTCVTEHDVLPTMCLKYKNLRRASGKGFVSLPLQSCVSSC